MTARVCCICGRSELPSSDAPACELRPYGPGGAPICFPCAMKPENLREAEKQLDERLGAAWKKGDGVAVLTKEGPKPVGTEGAYALAVAGKTSRDQDKE